MDIELLSRRVAGLTITDVSDAPHRGIAINLTDGTCLVIQREGEGLTATIRKMSHKGVSRRAGQPSERQREYLQFIVRFLSRFGISPAESDIQQHFMVSAPSVNQMMKTLKRRGFITRARDFTGQAIPRSIRVVVDLE